MSENIFVANSVLKKYGRNTALSDFSLSLEKGEIVALLGPNGAGKTTFVKSLLGLLKVNSGELTLFGYDINKATAKKRLAYLPEKFTFYSYYTVEGTLRFYANMYEVSSENINERIDYALRELGIFELKGRKISDLSKGQLQRVGLACSIVGEQEFVIWDEPFSGLDPIGMKEVKDLCLDLKKQGRTILINSHILSEMEKVADRVVIMNEGQIRAVGSVEEVSNGVSLEERFYKIVKGI
jgi:ABC-type multidrug transport system ATPase subunit